MNEVFSFILRIWLIEVIGCNMMNNMKIYKIIIDIIKKFGKEK